MKALLPSKARGKSAYHARMGPAIDDDSDATVNAGSYLSFGEVNTSDQKKILDAIEYNTPNPVPGINWQGGTDVSMYEPPLAPFDAAMQPPFEFNPPPSTSSTPTSSTAAGKRKADGGDSARTLARPPNSTKSMGSSSTSGRSVKSQRVTLPEAFQQMSTEIHGLGSSFDRAASALQERNSHVVTHSVDPIPLRKQKAIIQLQREEGLEDHEVVAAIKHFQNDVAVADSYLAIEKDSIRRLFLSAYLK
jgi:hypothetical protein